MTSRSLFAALSAVVLFSAAAPSFAQGGAAAPATPAAPAAPAAPSAPADSGNHHKHHHKHHHKKGADSNAAKAAK